MSSQYYREQNAFRWREHAIKIFQHYPESPSLVTKMTEILNDARLRTDAELVQFRYHLAYNIAAFFLNAFTAQISLSSRELVYFFTASPFDMDPENLVTKLSTPYLRSTQDTKSLHSLHDPRPSILGFHTKVWHSFTRDWVLDARCTPWRTSHNSRQGHRDRQNQRSQVSKRPWVDLFQRTAGVLGWTTQRTRGNLPQQGTHAFAGPQISDCTAHR